MARPLRLEFDGAVHHVMSRGIEGRRICADDTDRDIWLEILERAAERFGWRVFAFCLLDNHFHLFLRAPESCLSPGMRQLNGDYAGYFNRRHGRLGPLMQGRYKSVLVEESGHWAELSRYVHLNAVREASGARNLELAAALGFRSASAVTAACRRVRDGARTAKARRELEELVARAAGEL
jgi:putative transposase